MVGNSLRGGIVLVCALLAGCSAMEVKRTAEHAKSKEAYSLAISRPVPFSGQAACTRSPAIGQWVKLDFQPATSVLSLPNGVAAAAYCIAIPQGASVLQYASDSKGGMTYYESTIVLPSLLYLDEAFGVVLDDPLPDANYNSRMVSSGLDGTEALSGKLHAARYLVVYLHPKALDTGVKIDGGGWQTTVPFSPYGIARVRFHATQ